MSIFIMQEESLRLYAIYCYGSNHTMVSRFAYHTQRAEQGGLTRDEKEDILLIHGVLASNTQGDG